jgi:uncharacterized protein YjbJ (UPF0337 family)
VKEKVGQVTSNPDLETEGQGERLAGKVQKKVGQVEKVFEKVKVSGGHARQNAEPRRVTVMGEESAMSRTLGMILIALGLCGLAWGGFSYTTREKVVNIGPIHATRDKTHNLPLPPIVGAAALIGGLGLLFAGRK